MKLAIMQPYFFPYIGYFQLMSSVDTFVVYDNIQFVKKGWIHRNRILVNGDDSYFTLPLKKDSDFLNINDRFLAESFNVEKLKLIRKIEGAYKKAPFFNDVYPIISDILNYENTNLFSFIFNSIEKLISYLSIEVKLIKSTNLNFDIQGFKGQDKVIKICKSLDAQVYINAIGGVELYNKQTFSNEDIELKFIKSDSIKYKQFRNDFIPWLSIIDVMMFNSKEEIQKMIASYEFI